MATQDERRERGERRGKGLAREEVEIELRLRTWVLKEARQRLLLFSFFFWGCFFPAGPGRRPPSCLQSFPQNAQAGKHEQPVVNWRGSSNLTLLLHLGLLVRHRRHLPQHLSVFPPPHQPRCNQRHHTQHPRGPHTRTRTYTVHGTHGSRQSHYGVRASPISRQPVPPSAFLASLPNPSMENQTPRSCRTTWPDPQAMPCPPPTTFPAHTLSRRVQRLQLVGPRERPEQRTHPAARHKGGRVAAYIAILCSVCKSPTRPGVVAAVAPFDIVPRLISPPSRPFPAAPASAELPPSSPTPNFRSPLRVAPGIHSPQAIGKLAVDASSSIKPLESIQSCRLHLVPAPPSHAAPGLALHDPQGRRMEGEHSHQVHRDPSRDAPAFLGKHIVSSAASL